MEQKNNTDDFKKSLIQELMPYQIPILSPAPYYIVNMLAAGLDQFFQYAKDSANRYGLSPALAKKIFAETLLEYVTYYRIRNTNTDFASAIAFCQQTYGAAVKDLVNRVFP
jgi:hypothetical protein